VPSRLLALHAIEPPPTDPLLGKPLTLCADVQNTLLDAARVYAPQKGATPEQVETLVRALERFAAVALRDTGIDLTALVGAGAAGGWQVGCTPTCVRRLCRASCGCCAKWIGTHACTRRIA
jgi:glycerate kinase